MQDEITVSGGYQPTHQFISFVEGSASTPPDSSSFPLHVLDADHNLTQVDGGDPTEGFAPWVTDILVYPSSEYWETQLNGDRIRPYFDISISQYNTLRVPSAVHNYDLYVDTAKIYENLEVDGDLVASGTFTIGAILSPDDNFAITSSGDARFREISGKAKTRANIVHATEDINLLNEQTGSIVNCDPEGANLVVTLPATGESGTIFTLMQCGTGSTIQIQGVVKARGNILSEQYSACTIYWGDDSWYAFGDLV